MLDLLQVVRICSIHHMEQQISIGRFLKRSCKGIYQAVRQVANKPNCVRQRNQALRIAQVKLPRGGVQRGKQLVCCVSFGFNKCIKQRRFTGVGITNQRNAEGVAPVSLAALGLALFFYFAQALFASLDGFTNHALVELDLLFARATTHTRTTGLPLQVRPAPHQTGRRILQTSQFNLQFPFVTASPLAKYLQNQQRSVVDRQLKVALQITLLRRTQRLIKQHFSGADLLRQHFDFVGFSAADKQRSVWRATLARHTFNGFKAGCLRE